MITLCVLPNLEGSKTEKLYALFICLGLDLATIVITLNPIM